jgi:hypothetical protein
LTALIEEGLTFVLAGAAEEREAVQLPVCSVGGGTLPGVDINNSASLLDIMEQQ